MLADLTGLSPLADLASFSAPVAQAAGTSQQPDWVTMQGDPTQPETQAALDRGGSLFGITVGRGVAIILGLLLIAGGIFSIEKVHETIIETAKEGAKTAATAAAAA